MTDFVNEPTVWAARVVGASAGAAVSLVYLLPKSRREAASRFVTGLACGLVFGLPAGVWITTQIDLIDRLSASEVMLTGSAAASLSAWWGLGVLSRIAARFAARNDRS